MAMPEARSNLNALIDKQPMGAYQLFVIGLCFLVMVIDGYDLFMVAMAAPKIAASFGVEPASFAPVLAVQNLGLAVGTAVIGVFSDRYGRRKTLIVSIAAFSVFTLLTMAARDIVSFAAMRVVTGFFLAGVIPNTMALTNEITPARYRQGFVSFLYSGFAVGGGMASLSVGTVFAEASWQAIFATAAAAGFLLLALVVLLLPESVQFLVTRSWGHERALKQLRRMMSDVEIDAALFAHTGEERGKAPRSPVSSLFVGARRDLTVLMWMAFALSFASLSSFSALGPTVLSFTARLPLATAATLMTTFSLGGILGSGVSGFVLDRWGARFGLTLWYVATTGCWLLFAFKLDSGVGGHAIALLAGIAMTGAQGGLNSFVATVYPTNIRATGVGWAFGIGRLAGILSPLLFAPLVAVPGWEAWYFALLAVPTLLLALGVPVLVKASKAAAREEC